ncbi:uncharacterized protein LOC122850431 [Aphidius gifuensis]|uniref:uncharacterized protein LOC122850431 n=1 Tax=Aphidius gifuensis TaxID=684658 RepID=UPI001CDB8EC4|nr:uncharacterized protein LOC122850431 [Aphidius gifuensis]
MQNNPKKFGLLLWTGKKPYTSSVVPIENIRFEKKGKIRGKWENGRWYQAQLLFLHDDQEFLASLEVSEAGTIGLIDTDVVHKKSNEAASEGPVTVPVETQATAEVEGSIEDLVEAPTQLQVQDLSEAPTDASKEDLNAAVTKDPIKASTEALMEDSNNLVELYPGTNVFINSIQLEHLVIKLKNNPKEMTRQLLTIIIGKETLKNSSYSGKGGWRKIPENISTAIELYIVNKMKNRLSHKDFVVVITKYCNDLRNPRDQRN